MPQHHRLQHGMYKACGRVNQRSDRPVPSERATGTVQAEWSSRQQTGLCRYVTAFGVSKDEHREDATFME
jgi:hypothetical protein